MSPQRTPRTGDDAQLSLPLALADRLFALGLAPGTHVTTTRNRTVLVSWHPHSGLRLHAGYAHAPDDVLAAIVLFLKRRVPRAERLAARHRFMTFPVDRHAPSRAAPPRKPRPVPAEHVPHIERLTQLHELLNGRHFEHSLSAIPIRLSDKMRSRLGELRANSEGRPVEITISRRHIRRDGWPAVADTLLHEMVHQWQGETGLPLDHGRAFKRKAREVGISPAAVVDGLGPGMGRS